MTEVSKFVQKTIPTEKERRESFLRFAGRACIEAAPIQRSVTPPPPSVSLMLKEGQDELSAEQLQGSSLDTGSSSRGYSIDRDLATRITTLLVPSEERIGFPGSGTSSLRSSMLHLDIED